MSLISKIFLVFLSINVAYASEDSIPIFKTNEPIPQHGFDISDIQTPAIRFSPVDDVSLTHIELWFGNNSSALNVVKISLHEDKIVEKKSQPGKLIEEWSITISSDSWDLKKEKVISSRQPQLFYNQRYWIVAQSDASSTKSPIWGIANEDDQNISRGYYGVLAKDAQWEAGYSSIPTANVYGLLPSNQF